MKARIIYNPTSGKEVFHYDLPYVIERLSKKGYLVEVCPTQNAGHGIEIAKDACLNEIELIVVAGGDGTLNEVINGLMCSFNRPNLLHIPSGTTNDFASTINIPKKVSKCLDLLDSGCLVKVDIGKINDNYFTYVATSGVFTKITYTTPSNLKTHLGYLAYFISSFDEIPKLDKPIYYTIEVDGINYSDDYVFVLTSNSTGFGGFRNVFKNSKLNDGKFEFTLVPRTSYKIIKNAISGLINGLNEQTLNSGIIHCKGSKFIIKGSEPIQWNVDGERGPLGNIEIECINEAIRIYVPTKTKELLF